MIADFVTSMQSRHCVTSHSTGMIRSCRPCLRAVSNTSVISLWLDGKSAATTRTPDAARPSVIARPMPRAAPVTITAISVGLGFRARYRQATCRLSKCCGLDGSTENRLPSFGELFRLVDRGAVRNGAVMTLALLIEQLFNGVQFGLMLFLMAVGVTLVFGIMRVINLAHGSLFMIGGYFLMAALAWTQSLPARGPDSVHPGCASRDRTRSDRAAAVIPARPARPGASDLRAHTVLQRGRNSHLGTRADSADGAAAARRLC